MHLFREFLCFTMHLVTYKFQIIGLPLSCNLVYMQFRTINSTNKHDLTFNKVDTFKLPFKEISTTKQDPCITPHHHSLGHVKMYTVSVHRPENR